MNEIILSGNLGNDPKTSTAGEHVKSTFSLAVRDGKDRDDNLRTLWFFCETWDKTAEFVKQYLKRGTRVEVIGKAVPGSYEQNGIRQNTLRIVCRSVEFAGPKREESDDVKEEQASLPSSNENFMNIPDEELPIMDTVFCPNCFQEVAAGETCPNCGSTLPRE